jgi:alpha/beta superfamily hydrolase
VRAALDESERRVPGLPRVVGGFSFGSEMALRVGVGDARARALFALGFPLSRVADTSFLEACAKPRLFVQGEADEFGPADQMRQLVERLPPPRSLVVVQKSDHFFTGHLEALSDAVRSWAGGRPWQAS